MTIQTIPKRPKKNRRAEDVVNLDALSPRALITKRQLIASAFPVSDPTLWRRIKQGKFPPPDVEGGVTMWRVGTVTAWLDAQARKEAA